MTQLQPQIICGETEEDKCEVRMKWRQKDGKKFVAWELYHFAKKEAIASGEAYTGRIEAIKTAMETHTATMTQKYRRISKTQVVVIRNINDDLFVDRLTSGVRGNFVGPMNDKTPSQLIGADLDVFVELLIENNIVMERGDTLEFKAIETNHITNYSLVNSTEDVLHNEKVINATGDLTDFFKAIMNSKKYTDFL